ncbi:response regulator [bacterium]|nr:response regulator [bacterium]
MKHKESSTNRWKESTEEIRKILEQIPAVVYVAEIGEFGKWIYVSPQIEALLGYTPQEWTAQTGLYWQHIHPDDRNQVLEHEAASKRSGSFSSEYRMFARDGGELWIRDEGSISKDGTYYYGFLFDITKEKQAEEKAKEVERRQEETRLELEQHFRAVHKFEAIGRLAAGVAHDFNNLLMTITSYCELLKIKMSSPGPQELQEIQRAAEQGSVLTRHLLAFGGKQMQAPRKLDLNQVLRNLEPMLKRLVREDVQIKMILAEDLGVIEADLSQMEEMIINLTINAREAMPEAGDVLLETTNVLIDETVTLAHPNMPPGKYLRLCVSDTGVGLDEDAISHVFEPFYTRKDRTMGAGLRLPAVYGIVKQTGGFIWVYGEPGQGTTFKIYLPLVDAKVESPAEPEETTLQETSGQSILVVDDNDAVRMAIGAYLEMSGFQILQAANGKEAIQVASRENVKVDLVITDLVMPQMGGLELSQRLAMQNADLKVLYMSGYTEASVIRQGVLEPGAFFLQKPTSMQVLLKKVRELLSS